jgi:hypothetical protein
MYMWGVILMTVGGLSFVLPLFGRQFLLVSALGLTGAGAALIGVVLFAIGLLLFVGARVPVDRLSYAPTEPAGQPTMTPTPSPPSNAVRHPTSLPSTAEGRFGLNGGDFTDPYHFGVGIVGGSLAASQSIMVGMIGIANMPSQRAIKAQQAPVQLHALALVSATYYLCANKVSSSDKAALTQFATGMVDGFAAIFDPLTSSESSRRNALAIYGLVQDYTHSLATEMASVDANTLGDDPFETGATARLFVHNIAGQCGIQESLATSHLERLMLEKVGRECGIVAVLKAMAGNQVAYLRS